MDGIHFVKFNPGHLVLRAGLATTALETKGLGFSTEHLGIISRVATGNTKNLGVEILRSNIVEGEEFISLKEGDIMRGFGEIGLELKRLLALAKDALTPPKKLKKVPPVLLGIYNKTDKTFFGEGTPITAIAFVVGFVATACKYLEGKVKWTKDMTFEKERLLMEKIQRPETTKEEKDALLRTLKALGEGERMQMEEMDKTREILGSLMLGLKPSEAALFAFGILVLYEKEESFYHEYILDFLQTLGQEYPEILQTLGQECPGILQTLLKKCPELSQTLLNNYPEISQTLLKKYPETLLKKMYRILQTLLEKHP